MKRVTGIGGIFIKSANTARCARGTGSISASTSRSGAAPRFDGTGLTIPTVTAPPYGACSRHRPTTSNPVPRRSWCNYRVEKLHELLAVLREEGCQVVGEPRIPNSANSAGSWTPTATRSNCGNRPRGNDMAKQLFTATRSREFRGLRGDCRVWRSRYRRRQVAPHAHASARAVLSTRKAARR